jgi:hypothetical protein
VDLEGGTPSSQPHFGYPFILFLRSRLIGKYCESVSESVQNSCGDDNSRTVQPILFKLGTLVKFLGDLGQIGQGRLSEIDIIWPICSNLA